MFDMIDARRASAGLCWSLALALSGAAHAQTSFPTKPIRIIVSSAPGGAMDSIGRSRGDKARRRRWSARDRG